MTPTPTSSRLTLLSLLLFTAFCLYTSLTIPPPAPRPGEGDAALYRAILTRTRSGEPYYSAVHAELLSRHYGLQSVLNWRPPTLNTFATLSPTLAKSTLIALAFLTLFLAIRTTKQQGGGRLARLLALSLTGPLLLTILDDTFLFSELWAGTLILLSLFLYPRRPLLSTLPALAALFLRELAAPYVLILLLHTLIKKDEQGGEINTSRPYLSPSFSSFILLPSSFLSLGLFTYFLYFLWHAHQVHLHLLPSDPAYPTGWIQFGGLRFLLSTARQNTWLLLTPAWLTALYLPLAILGLFALPKPISSLALPTGLTYLALFSIVGKSFNDYWGLLTSPLLAVSFCYALKYLPTLILSESKGKE